MGWIWCVHCEKLWCDFVARTSSLIAPVQPILHRVPGNNETLRNAPTHYKMLQNMSLVPMVWIECVLCEKFWCEFMARTFALIALVQPIPHRVSCSNEIIQNAPKLYKTHQFIRLASNGVDQVRSLRKTLMRFRGTNFSINCTSSNRFAPSFVQ